MFRRRPSRTIFVDTVTAINRRAGSRWRDWRWIFARWWTTSRTRVSEGVVFVGTSMGCAVIWSYLQLFGDEERLRGVVLVDQAPLQNRRPDWNLGSKGCFDAAPHAKLAEAVRADMDAFADGNAEACLVSMEEIEKREPGVLHALKSETLKCDPEALCEIMYDHTHQDWRSAAREHRRPRARPRRTQE